MKNNSLGLLPIDTLPKDIIDHVESERSFACNERFSPKTTVDSMVPALSDWLLLPQNRRIPSVQRYLSYLNQMWDIFGVIALDFPKQNHGREGQKDEGTIGTSSLEMLHLANHLYVLDSYGVAGAVLECGCFKGFSSCCLSHACALLSRDLIVADSFEGLPIPEKSDAGYYQAGDFAGSFGEVQRNIRMFGRSDSVQYVKGWFSESLKGWKRPIALLWIDVDLYQSTMDVLESVFETIDPRGAIFSHEFSRKADICAGQIVRETGPAGALRDFLTARSIAYTARHVIDCNDNYSYGTGMVTVSTSVAPATPLLFESLVGSLPDRHLSARVRRICRRYSSRLLRLLGERRRMRL